MEEMEYSTDETFENPREYELTNERISRENAKSELKYELTGETINANGHTLHRIRALKDFGDVHKGDLGGFVESEKNLSHYGNCWLYGNSKAYENAKVHQNASLWENAEVSGNARVTDEAEVSGNVKVTDEAVIEGSSECKGNCEIYGKAWVYRSSYLNGNVKVYDEAQVCNATLLDNVKAYGDARIGGFNTLKGNEEAGYGYVSDENIILSPYEKDMLDGKIDNSNKGFRISEEATVDATAKGNEEPRADFSKIKIFGNAERD